MTQMLALFKKDFKAAIMKHFNEQLQMCLTEMKKVSGNEWKI